MTNLNPIQSAALTPLLAQGYTRASTTEGAVIVRRGADVRIVRLDGSVRRCDRIR